MNIYPKKYNVFTSFLEILKVRYTSDFSNKYFNEHPDKYNLFGLSKMLSDYGINNAGTKIENKEQDIFNIECPFITQLGSNFVIVYKVDPEQVFYIQDGKKISVSISQFIQVWSGIILLAESTSDSIEPDYKEHRKDELLHIAQKSILILAGFFIFGLTYINHSLFANLGISLLLIVNLLGVYICSLLVLKQMNIHSQSANKICSLFRKSDCNNVLESKAAKLWGVFGWSEIGLGYFVANVLLLLFLPNMVFTLAILNILTLPYSFWSVWYQKTKAKQWCPLCLIVQILLWSIFTLNCLFGYICVPEFDLSVFLEIQFACCVYAVGIFGFNLVIPIFAGNAKMEQLKQKYNSLIANENVFSILLKQQSHYEVSKTDSQILLGNSEAPMLISILTNPFCSPCANMHIQVKKLLKENYRNVCIQYIFSSFDKTQEYVSKYLIAAWMQKEEKEFETIIANWFKRGKYLGEAFFKELQLDIINPNVETEFQKHKAWLEKTQLKTTPIILVNGYKLLENYQLEDLRYFTKFNVDVK